MKGVIECLMVFLGLGLFYEWVTGRKDWKEAVEFSANQIGAVCFYVIWTSAISIRSDVDTAIQFSFFWDIGVFLSRGKLSLQRATETAALSALAVISYQFFWLGR